MFRNYLLEREAAQKAGGGPVDLDTLKLLSQLNPVRLAGGAKEANQVRKIKARLFYQNENNSL